MKQIILQAQIVEKGSEYLMQFGVLGLFAALLLATVYYLEKQRTKRDEEQKAEKESMRERIAKLEEKLENLQDEISGRLESIIIENSKVLARNADIMDQVKNILIKQGSN